MTKNRVERLNSLLKEVISEVIRTEVKNPHVHQLITVTSVDVTRDLRHAKVYISVIGSDKEKEETMKALESASKFIAINASKQIVIRFFPELHFKLDEGVSRQMRLEGLLKEISDERTTREHSEEELLNENTSEEELPKEIKRKPTKKGQPKEITREQPENE